MSLKEYSRKRDFKKTAEPEGKLGAGKKYRFVIQKHAASHLHYDFRLELDRTLKSWAVPKGVPFTKGEKRLAVQVEDHPVGYIDFEGTIPQGQYGGGTVMVWDFGTFEPLSKSPVKDLEKGKLHFVLHGKKLEGEWYLVRLRGGKEWLLIKGGESMKPISKKLDDSSAHSGKTMQQLAGAKKGKVWESNKAADVSFVEPMKARLVERAPEGDWIYEIKLDGYRTLALKQGREVRLLSRNKKSFNDKFPEIAETVAELDCRDAILDGEIVALDPKGRSSFQLLQAYDLGEERPAIYFYVFDLLQLNGENLKKKPLSERKALLEKLLAKPPDGIRYSASLAGSATQLLKQARKLGLEGLIGKRSESVYEDGRRSGAWIKLKLHAEQEMVIGGYTEPEGSRQHFGALLMGYYEKDRLHFAGKVGTGFDEKLLRKLFGQFSKLSRAECPFVGLPEKKLGYGGLTAGEMKHCHWLKPKLVAQIKFSEWTRDGKLRQPVFLGLREDKDAADVVREKPQ